jgi:hypothetical protein
MKPASARRILRVTNAAALGDDGVDCGQSR